MTDTGNLPNWPGAAVVYGRAARIAAALNVEAFRRQRAADKRKRFRFTPDPEATAIIEAMNAGNEEALKAAAHEHRHVWIDKP